MNKTLWVCLFVVSSVLFPATVFAGVGISPSSISFGSVPVNTVSSAATIVVTNNGNQGVTISSIASSLPEFVVGGISTPFFLAARSSVTVVVYFQPDTAATLKGSIVVNGVKHGWGSASVSVSGTGISALSSTPGSLLSVSASSLTFSNILVGTSGSLPFAITNSGTTTVNISQVVASGTGFSVSGFSGSASLSPGQTLSLAAVFSPTTTGPATGAISVVSNAANSPSTISLSATAVQPLISVTPSSVSFGGVLVGKTQSQVVTLQNSGTANLNVTQATISGAGFALSGLALPLTLAPGGTASFSVGFAPASTGSFTGSLSVTSNATSTPVVVALSGTGIQPQITVIPSSVSFGNVTVAVTNSQTITIQNPGTAGLSVSQAAVSGTGFSISGLTLPVFVAPGGSTFFNVVFAPTSASTYSGTLTLVSNAPTSPTSIALGGTGISPVLQLSANPTSLSFGTLNTGTSATQSVAITNSGNSTVSISQVTASGTNFSIGGSTSLPLSLAPGQSSSVSVTFVPTSTGPVSGNLTVTSNAANSPLVVALSGSGSSPTSHSVSLSWTASSSTYAGFNVYRGTVSGGPYSRINSSLILTASFSDISVSSGQTYYYVATEVNSTGGESAYSSEVSAVIP